MVTAQDVRAVALSLPRTEEHLIRDQVKFRLVRGDRDVNDLPDPELDLIADQVFLGAGQGQRHSAHVLRGYHRLDRKSVV